VKRLLAVVAGLALALVGTMAVAAWLSTGADNGSVTAGALSAPTAVVGAQTVGSGDVGVSWTASAGTPAPTGYYVLRAPSSGPVEPACGTSVASPTAGTSCTDSGVPLGSYTYIVVAVFHSWTSASTASAEVTVARAQQVVTITSTPASPTFGGSYTLVASGGGSGNPIVFGSSTPGVCTVLGAQVSFVHAGTCTLTADQAGSTYYDAAPQATQQFQVAKASQTINFTSTAPTAAVVGGAGYAPTATGGGSGNPVTFTIDPTASGVCKISAGVVTYQHVGTCVVDADQAGDADHLAANRVQQSVAVGQGSQAINFTSVAPTNPKVGGSYGVSASGGGSGNEVTFSSTTSSVCSVVGTTVSFVGAGTCTIDADQAGNADYLAAATVHQSFDVTKNDQTIHFTSTAPTTATVGGSYTASATATSGLDVTFGTDTSAVCTVSPGGSVSFVGVGTCHVNADQSGNFAYNAAQTQEQSFGVVAVADTTDPTITSIEPGDEGPAGWNSIACSTGSNTGRICVGATDDVGVASVSITLKRNSNGWCWNGASSTTFQNVSTCSQIPLSLSGSVWVSNQLVRQTGGGNPNFASGQYTLTVTVKDAAGNTATATRTFTINGS
jgi:hypothetical protein